MVIGADMTDAAWTDIADFLVQFGERTRTKGDYLHLHGCMTSDFAAMLTRLIRDLNLEDYVGWEAHDGKMHHDGSVQIRDGRAAWLRS